MSAILKIKPLGFPWQTDDPFLFCAYHKDEYPEGNTDLGPKESLNGRPIGQDFDPTLKWRMYHGTRIPGFPAHPHLGFETVTIVEEGLVDHSDSLGAAARFGNGDVQWITTGRGLQHSEMFPLLHQDKENPFLLFQIWLNLPKKSKKVDPYFKMMWNEEIPVEKVTDPDGNLSTIKVIAGKYGKATAPKPNPDSWASDSHNDVSIWLIKLSANAELTLPKAEKGTNRSLYFYKGSELQTEDFTIPVNHRIQLNPEEDLKLKNSNEQSYLLLLQGKPIEEPVVQQGPFVANSVGEIKQGIMDFQQNEFGGWPWPAHDNVHDPDKGRFAIFPDGSEVYK